MDWETLAKSQKERLKRHYPDFFAKRGTYRSDAKKKKHLTSNVIEIG